MRWHKNMVIVGAVIAALAATTAAALGSTAGRTVHKDKADEVRLALTPSSSVLGACMPGAELNVKIALKAEEHGSDRFEIEAHSLPPNRDYAIFLIQQAGAPFGAAEYIGDFSTDDAGNAHTNLQLIVQEAFSSTIVNGVRTRADLNRIGVWFADPAGDDFCPGAGGAPTPFDGDGSAGVQVFTSANADPLPAP